MDDTEGERTVDGGYVPSVKPIKEAESPYLLMEFIVDKLKILDYEQEFCSKATEVALSKPLSHVYFALPHSNPNEQFFYFTSLVSWIFNLGGHSFATPGQFDDPNATSANIVDELKKLGFVTDFPPNKLKEGWGDIVCSVMNSLTDWVMERRGFQFKKPIHKGTQSKTDHKDEEEGEDEEILADEAIVDDEEDEEVLNDHIEDEAFQDELSRFHLY